MATQEIQFRACPIATAFTHLGKKWTVNILRDMFRGSKKFSDFLAGSPDMSTRMLSLRLKDMEEDGLISKNIISKTPLQIEYQLTEKGFALNKVLFELALYSYEYHSNDVFKPSSREVSLEVYEEVVKSELKLPTNSIQ